MPVRLGRSTARAGADGTLERSRRSTLSLSTTIHAANSGPETAIGILPEPPQPLGPENLSGSAKFYLIKTHIFISHRTRRPIKGWSFLI